MKLNPFIILFTLYSSQVFAKDLVFYSAHFPPYAYENEKENTKGGALYDVSMEIIKRLDLKTEIRFAPWPRARYEAETKDNVLLIPLARTTDRENKYTWLVHVLDDPYVLFALKSTSFNINNHEDAKKLKIGVLKTSVADQMLRDLGYKNLEVATNDLANLGKLKLGRIDAWVGPLSAIDEYKKQVGIGHEQLRVGVVFTVLKEYIGASKNLDPKVQKQWRDAFEEMKKDGTYRTIMKKYSITSLH